MSDEGRDQVEGILRFLPKEELEDPEDGCGHVAEGEVPLLELAAQEHVRDQRALPVARTILVHLGHVISFFLAVMMISKMIAINEASLSS